MDIYLGDINIMFDKEEQKYNLIPLSPNNMR